MTTLSNRRWLCGLAGVAALASAGAAAASTDRWAGDVASICQGALLFEGTHEIGTRAGALAVADDIRDSTGRRLQLIAALPESSTQASLAARWLTVERQLADTFASTYVAIYDVIAAADTPAKRARMPKRLQRLLHRPDALKKAGERLEARLAVPDCTGGDRPAPTVELVTPAAP